MTELSPIIKSYLDHGWPVFPLKGKQPLTPKGFYDATTDIVKVTEWALKFPDCNWGFRPGVVDMAVVDIDPRNGGDEVWQMAVDEAGAEMFDTPTVETGGGGYHRYLLTNGRDIPNRKLGPGVDLISKTGYVVVPPSIHSNGKKYRWKLAPSDVPFADLPDWVLEMGAPSKGRAAPIEDVIPDGTRGETLASLAGSMRRRGMTEEELYVALSAVNQNRCVPPYPDKKVRGIAKSYAK